MSTRRERKLPKRLRGEHIEVDLPPSLSPSLCSPVGTSSRESAAGSPTDNNLPVHRPDPQSRPRNPQAVEGASSAATSSSTAGLGSRAGEVISAANQSPSLPVGKSRASLRRSKRQVLQKTSSTEEDVSGIIHASSTQPSSTPDADSTITSPQNYQQEITAVSSYDHISKVTPESSRTSRTRKSVVDPSIPDGNDAQATLATKTPKRGTRRLTKAQQRETEAAERARNLAMKPAAFPTINPGETWTPAPDKAAQLAANDGFDLRETAGGARAVFEDFPVRTRRRDIQVLMQVALEAFERHGGSARQQSTPVDAHPDISFINFDPQDVEIQSSMDKDAGLAASEIQERSLFYHSLVPSEQAACASDTKQPGFPPGMPRLDDLDIAVQLEIVECMTNISDWEADEVLGMFHYTSQGTERFWRHAIARGTQRRCKEDGKPDSLEFVQALTPGDEILLDYDAVTGKKVRQGSEFLRAWHLSQEYLGKWGRLVAGKSSMAIASPIGGTAESTPAKTAKSAKARFNTPMQPDSPTKRKAAAVSGSFELPRAMLETIVTMCGEEARLEELFTSPHPILKAVEENDMGLQSISLSTSQPTIKPDKPSTPEPKHDYDDDTVDQLERSCYPNLGPPIAIRPIKSSRNVETEEAKPAFQSTSSAPPDQPDPMAKASALEMPMSQLEQNIDSILDKPAPPQVSVSDDHQAIKADEKLGCETLEQMLPAPSGPLLSGPLPSSPFYPATTDDQKTFDNLPGLCSTPRPKIQGHPESTFAAPFGEDSESAFSTPSDSYTVARFQQTSNGAASEPPRRPHIKYVKAKKTAKKTSKATPRSTPSFGTAGTEATRSHQGISSFLDLMNESVAVAPMGSETSMNSVDRIAQRTDSQETEDPLATPSQPHQGAGAKSVTEPQTPTEPGAAQPRKRGRPRKADSAKAASSGKPAPRPDQSSTHQEQGTGKKRRNPPLPGGQGWRKGMKGPLPLRNRTNRSDEDEVDF